MVLSDDEREIIYHYRNVCAWRKSIIKMTAASAYRAEKRSGDDSDLWNEADFC